MLFKKTRKYEKKKDSQFSFFNDYGDLKFTLFLGNISPDGWIPCHCALLMNDFQSGIFNEIYSSGDGSIVSDTNIDDIRNLVAFLEKVEAERNQTHKFMSENQDFAFIIGCTEDIYRITTTIDLCTMNSERLDSGHGDSEISLTFNCTVQQIQDFRNSLTDWLKNS
jgi:hypothetical protein